MLHVGEVFFDDIVNTDDAISLNEKPQFEKLVITINELWDLLPIRTMLAIGTVFCNCCYDF